jgi:hypothetical protein
MAEYLQTPEMLRRPGMEEAIAAQAGVGTPEATLDRQKMEEARRPPFTPSIVTVDGRRFVTTSNNSAIPLPALSSGDLPVEPWMLAEDREAFLREIQKLPREAALEVLNLRRQARPEEYRSTNPIDALFAAQNGGRGVFPAGPAGKKQLDDATARRFLNEAKGDRARARELARQAGYEW